MFLTFTQASQLMQKLCLTHSRLKFKAQNTKRKKGFYDGATTLVHKKPSLK